MVAATYQSALKRVLVYEGGYTNHPKDPGGVTLEGVIQRVYNGYRQRKGLPTRPLTPDMRGTPEWIKERDEIYRIQYWDAIKGDELPAGVDFVVFDGAVNSGPSQSIKWLQRALGMNMVDGVLGQATLAALQNDLDNDQVIVRICQRREAFLRALSTFPTFGKGWLRRVASVKIAGTAWASGSIPAPANFIDCANAKAQPSSAKPLPKTGLADSSSGLGIATATVSQATDTVAPISDTNPKLTLLYQVLLYIGVAITVAGIAWGAYARYRAKKLSDALDLSPEQGTP